MAKSKERRLGLNRIKQGSDTQ